MVNRLHINHFQTCKPLIFERSSLGIEHNAKNLKFFGIFF
jgi:hypothetical protein